MAAEATVSFVVEKLGDLLIEESHLLRGVRDQFEWIQRELRGMLCFLKDADAKQKGDERVRNWVREVTDVSHEAEDIIDIFIINESAKKTRRRRKRWFIEIAQSYFSELKSDYNVGKEIKRVKSKIDDIVSSTNKFGITNINEGEQEITSSSIQSLHEQRRFSALLEEPDVVGLQEDMKMLVERLMNQESRLRVLSIVGMGGSGKTTLAKKLYNQIKVYFECDAFIYLSQGYRIKDVLVSIIKCVMSLSHQEIEMSNEVELGKMLYIHLIDKRYLVVIDDIWHMEAWDKLKLVLPDSSNGSRIMLTTRKREVALHAAQWSGTHDMRLLNEDESWELFQKKVFQGENTSNLFPKELEGIGRLILARCGGLPLAILVLGGVLSRRAKNTDAWWRVLDSVTLHLSESSNHCMDILALSYKDLPYYLKSCFLYLGLFPEDFEIVSKDLIELWVAEGFIQRRGNESMEDVAEDYLEDLIGRSMIQVARKKSNGSIRTCRVHDLLRDLSISEAELSNFFNIYKNDDSTLSSTSVRRLAIHHGIDENDFINRSTASLLRSMLFFSGTTIDLYIILDRGVKLLRVLDLQHVHLSKKTLPEEIGELIHLRYLNLCNAEIQSIPSSIASLFNLRTLKIGSNYFGVCILPNEIYNLERLRHLYAYGFTIDGHPRLYNLRNLQTLRLKAGSWIDGLDKATGLRILRIWGDLSSHHDALLNSIEKLSSLRSFTVNVGVSIPSSMPFSHHQRLQKMYLDGEIKKLPEFSPNISKLSLTYSQLQQEGMVVLEKLPNLLILRLLKKSYCSKNMICSAGGFPKLQFLEFNEVKELEELVVDEEAMPNLKSVLINDCDRLLALPEKVRNLLK